MSLCFERTKKSEETERRVCKRRRVEGGLWLFESIVVNVQGVARMVDSRSLISGREGGTRGTIPRTAMD